MTRRQIPPRRRQPLVLVSVLTLGACVGLSLGLAGCSSSHPSPPTPGPAPAGWSTVALPPLPKATTTSLYAAATLPDSTGWAVGTSSDGGVFKATSEHWNGRQWSTVPAANPKPIGNDLFGVAALSDTDAWAVGSGAGGADAAGSNTTLNNDTTLIEHWDGAQWRALEPPQVPALKTYESVLRAVSAVSADDVWAVGFGDAALIEHWDGTRWSVSPTPDLHSDKNGSSLLGVAAASATDVWAVGANSVAGRQACLLEHWDGATWSSVACPLPPGAGDARLSAVTALSPTDVWAVGFYMTGQTETTKDSHGLIEHFDGTTWSVVPSPHLTTGSRPPGGYSDDLVGVAARAPDDVYAVGGSRLVHWDGKTWTVEAYQASGATLEAIAAPPRGTLWAVGERLTGSTLAPIAIAQTK